MALVAKANNKKGESRDWWTHLKSMGVDYEKASTPKNV